jgi:hypothetical protein
MQSNQYFSWARTKKNERKREEKLTSKINSLKRNNANGSNQSKSKTYSEKECKRLKLTHKKLVFAVPSDGNTPSTVPLQ